MSASGPIPGQPRAPCARIDYLPVAPPVRRGLWGRGAGHPRSHQTRQTGVPTLGEGGYRAARLTETSRCWGGEDAWLQWLGLGYKGLLSLNYFILVPSTDGSMNFIGILQGIS